MAQLTTADLQQAAENLRRLRIWIKDLYPMCIEYEDAVFHALNSTKDNGSWTNFFLDIFIDIAVGFTSAAAVASGGALAVPALACLSAFLHDWGIGKDKPNDLDAEFAIFQFGHQKMQYKIEQKLSSLVDPRNNYGNLQNAWKDDIEFNGKTYTLGDLATSNFPDLGDDYNELQSNAFTYFKQSVWNLVIMKCCTYYRNYYDPVDTPRQPAGVLLNYLRSSYYPQNKGVYVRAEIEWIQDDSFRWYVYAYNLGINGDPFPDAASKVLFKDDTPGHIINPEGLFNRSYVFQQFSVTKPVFEYGHELGDDRIGNLNINADDWEFTGGMFPQLIKT